MRRDKSRYITIPPREIEQKQGFDVSDPKAFAEKKEHIGALGAIEVSYSLARLKEEIETPQILLVDFGDHAVSMVRACRDAGFEVSIVYTQDMVLSTAVKLAQCSVCIADTFSETVFRNSYAILNAAKECEAQAILFVDPTLAVDEGFLRLAQARSLKVFRALNADVPQAGWLICETKQRAEGEEEVWRRCPACDLLFDERGLLLNHCMCPACGSYFRMSSLERINDMLDAGSFDEWWQSLPLKDPLSFPGYQDKLISAQEKTNLDEAVRCGSGSIAGIRFALGIMDPQFFMGSMGSTVGEKITRTIERATEENLPLVIFTASGGARMQEGLLSLMQMAKISSAISRHSEAGLPYIAVLTDPTTGGVTASFAMQGDIVFAEPGALIGFAGQRVIRDTIKRELPEGFQTAEFALKHGLIDAIVDRANLRSRIAHVLAIHAASPSRELFADGDLMSYTVVSENLKREHQTNSTLHYGMFPQIKSVMLTASRKIRPSLTEAANTSTRFRQTKRLRAKERFAELSHGRFDAEEGSSLHDSSPDQVSVDGANAAWESVQLARNTQRPTSRYYIDSIVDGFIELHGDRSFSDDAAIISGIGWIGACPVTVIAQEKGSDLKERLTRNFGCPQPEGYRKSLRLMKQAAKFGRPIICLVDTQGAFCGMEAEERGQGNAIAENLMAMAGFEVPIISVFIGEGGSGGALALAVADRVAMQQHAVYSILSPEGFASILWKDGTRAAEAAAVMKMSAEDAVALGVAEVVLSEGPGPAHENPKEAAERVREYLVATLDELNAYSTQQLLEERYKRFRKF